MRPQNLKTKIFLDSGDPKETEETIKLLGFLDGQTTNPTLIAKNPEAQQRLAKGNKFTRDEALDLYRQTVRKISDIIPLGSVSVEVYADKTTSAESMIKQAQDMYSWIPNAHIKFPATKEGIAAAHAVNKNGVRTNLTLVFTQEQAAAVFDATKGAKKGDVLLSPFVGRLDDRGEKGFDLVSNIAKMYSDTDKHVEILAASVRNLDHFYQAIGIGSDIVTVPFKVLKEWAEKGKNLPEENFKYDYGNLRQIPYKNVDINQSWQNIAFADELIDKGLERFANDWNSIIA